MQLCVCMLFGQDRRADPPHRALSSAKVTEACERKSQSLTRLSQCTERVVRSITMFWFVRKHFMPAGYSAVIELRDFPHPEHRALHDLGLRIRTERLNHCPTADRGRLRLLPLYSSPFTRIVQDELTSNDITELRPSNNGAAVDSPFGSCQW